MLAHARALLGSAPEGATSYIEVDVREPEMILRSSAQTLDFDQPVALMLLGVLQHVVNDDEAYAIVNRLLDALPSGSYLALNEGTNVISRARDEAVRLWTRGVEPQ